MHYQNTNTASANSSTSYLGTGANAQGNAKATSYADPNSTNTNYADPNSTTTNYSATNTGSHESDCS